MSDKDIFISTLTFSVAQFVLLVVFCLYVYFKIVPILRDKLSKSLETIGLQTDAESKRSAPIMSSTPKTSVDPELALDDEYKKWSSRKSIEGLIVGLKTPSKKSLSSLSAATEPEIARNGVANNGSDKASNGLPTIEEHAEPLVKSQHSLSTLSAITPKSAPKPDVDSTAIRMADFYNQYRFGGSVEAVNPMSATISDNSLLSDTKSEIESHLDQSFDGLMEEVENMNEQTLRYSDSD